jgi:hypothetical protein
MGEIYFTETLDTAVRLVRLLEWEIGLSQAFCLHRTSQQRRVHVLSGIPVPTQDITEKNPCAEWSSRAYTGHHREESVC